MQKTKNSLVTIIIWIIVLMLAGNLSLFSTIFSGNSSRQQVTEDPYMNTLAYDTTIEVKEDNSYRISENITVVFDTSRHGIYRYIPTKGVISEVAEDGTITDTPYFAKFSDIRCKTHELDVSDDNGNKVLRFGSPDYTVNGQQEYQLSYHITPATSKGYPNAYYNVFPTGWQNSIPEGSRFTIQFPKDFDHDRLRFYYGAYGEQYNGNEIIDLSWEGNTVTGTLKTALQTGQGLTFFAQMEDGYFTSVHTSWSINLKIIGISAAVLLILLILFVKFGKDEPIIPSVQFQPPEGLDSAAVGYIIDGNVSTTDIMSMILFWADRGFLSIRETKNNSLAFTKLRDLPADAPDYAVRFFQGMFGSGSVGKDVTINSLKYRMATTFEKTQYLLKKRFSPYVYTTSSKVARGISFALAMIPLFVFTIYLSTISFSNAALYLLVLLYFIGLLIFANNVDFWYSKASSSRTLMGSAATALCITPLIAIFLVYGIRMMQGRLINLLPGMICVLLVSFAAVPLSGFMKKRTSQCVQWMGYLAGLRDFIETAELERMQVIAQESPHLFYHILPFAYVFGLSDILLDKMKDLTLPAPEWYYSRSGNPYFDYHRMHRMIHTDMRHLATTITTPRPQSNSSSGSSGFSGSSFSGGGGFSGGGFGGGGGGSW